LAKGDLGCPVVVCGVVKGGEGRLKSPHCSTWCGEGDSSRPIVVRGVARADLSRPIVVYGVARGDFGARLGT
jgi:hypothetical protein